MCIKKWQIFFAQKMTEIYICLKNMKESDMGGNPHYRIAKNWDHTGRKISAHIPIG